MPADNLILFLNFWQDFRTAQYIDYVYILRLKFYSYSFFV